MVAPAALTLGLSCAGSSGLASSHGDRSSFPNPPPLHLRSSCFPTPNGRLPLPCSGPRPLLLPPLCPARAVAVDSGQLGSSPPADEGKPRKYYFVVANAKFMLDEEEHFKELLSERLRNFGERSREKDFWLVVEPKFLDRFPGITKRLKRPAVALVSTDSTWITFMKLRLDRVLTESFEAESLEEALASKPADLHFEKPENWTAPYPKYEFGWWEPFLPQGSCNTEA
uniref:Ycf54-like protein n=1 Tax=Anthurium amnicola TaxID=1678845 RepID=A0A1D1ZF08_9ARAE